jgi:hypothetical protein
VIRKEKLHIQLEVAGMIISGINLRTGITPGWVEVVDHTGRMPIG